MRNNLFAEKPKNSLGHARSPEQLNEYIKVTSGAVWTGVAAIILLLAALLAWGVFGRVTSIVSTKLIKEDGVYACYLPPEEAAKIREGMPVRAGGFAGAVTNIAAAPVAISEIDASDYVKSELALKDFSVRVEVEIPGLESGNGAWEAIDAAVETSARRPIDLLLGGEA